MSTISNERLEKLSEYDCADRYEVMSMATELLALRKERERAVTVAWTDADETREKFEAWAEEARDLPAGHLKKQRNGRGNYSVQIYTYMWHAWSACSADMLQSGNDDIGSWSNHKTTPTDKPKSEMSQQAERLLRDTTALAVTLSAETDTTPQQFESLAFKSVVPEGWKLVPIVLTKEMRGKIHPFAEALCHGCGREVVADCEYNVTASWNDMLAVAPEPCK
ncbi:hypothetical protein PN661_003721 [Cronobacter sakazakii]|nr:hypothetical protein [Cronobacter sakazakii]EKK5312995.1 hypothetical protein [Cronobacter sakazakii]